jgi:hypothetical protein
MSSLPYLFSLPWSPCPPCELRRGARRTRCGRRVSELRISPGGLRLTAVALVFQVDDQGRPRPKLRCDVCGGMIENPAGGIVLWDQPSEIPGTVLEPSFHCGGCVAKEGGAPPRSMPLDLFTVYLMNNIHLSPGILEGAGRSLGTSVSL